MIQFLKDYGYSILGVIAIIIYWIAMERLHKKYRK